MIIGLTGRARSGKDTAASILVAQYAFASISFARPIRKFIADLIGVDLRQLEVIKDEFFEPFGCTPRFMMQTLGTEWGRSMIHGDIWVKTCLARIAASNLTATPLNWVISDVRFPNEAKAIKAAGGLVVEITRPGCLKIEEHSSEAGLPKNLVDYSIGNAGTTLDLARSLMSLPIRP